MAKPVKYYGKELYEGKDLAGLRDTYNKWIKTANERIRVTTSAKNAGTAHAYQNKVAPLVGSKFVKEAKAGTKNAGNAVFVRLPKGATEQNYKVALAHLTDFLQSKTSTVQGMQELHQERINQIKEDYPTMSDQTAEAIARFLGSPEGQALRKIENSNLVKQALQKQGAISSWWLTANDVAESARQWMESGQTLADWIRQSDTILESMESF